jgi:hypothetical protein
MVTTLPPSLISLLVAALALPHAAASREAEHSLAAIEKISLAHAKRPGTTTESELRKAIPRSAVVGLARLLKEKPTLEVSQALVTGGEAALDLAKALATIIGDHEKKKAVRAIVR